MATVKKIYKIDYKSFIETYFDVLDQENQLPFPLIKYCPRKIY
jgi:hypothetical protein